MSSLFPRRSPVDEQREEARVLRVDEAAADDVFGALGSETARTILAALYEEPRTATDVADVAGTSLQNARYHLERLREADLIGVVDTWYSDRGTEMKVYAPAAEGVVVFAGEEHDRGRLRAAVERLLASVGFVAGNVALLDSLAMLSRIIGALGVLVLVGLLANQLMLGGITDTTGMPVSEQDRNFGAEAPPPDSVGEPLITLDPAAVVLLGGIATAALIAVGALLYRRRLS